MKKKVFNSKIEEYVDKFGSADRFVMKIIGSLDCPFSVVNVDSLEVAPTNAPNLLVRKISPYSSLRISLWLFKKRET